jgi:hypothetical protein
MQRQPLTPLEQTVIGIVSAVAIKGNVSNFEAQERYFDDWDRTIQCLGSDVYVSAHICNTPTMDWPRGILFPIREPCTREADYCLLLTPEQALALAARLEERSAVIRPGVERSWRWWLSDIWKWQQRFALTREEVAEIIAALRDAADYVIYGPAELPFDREQLRAAQDGAPTVTAWPSPRKVSGNQQEWQARVDFPSLGSMALYRVTNGLWHLGGAGLPAEYVVAGMWDWLKPELDAAIKRYQAEHPTEG